MQQEKLKELSWTMDNYPFGLLTMVFDWTKWSDSLTNRWSGQLTPINIYCLRLDCGNTRWGSHGVKVVRMWNRGKEGWWVAIASSADPAWLQVIGRHLAAAQIVDEGRGWDSNVVISGHLSASRQGGSVGWQVGGVVTQGVVQVGWVEGKEGQWHCSVHWRYVRLW